MLACQCCEFWWIAGCTLEIEMVVETELAVIGVGVGSWYCGWCGGMVRMVRMEWFYIK